jgi:hypothetical protein
LVTLSDSSNSDQGPKAGFEFSTLKPGALHVSQ